MKLLCYFCQQERDIEKGHLEICQCSDCAQKFNLHSVYTSYNKGEFYIGHLYIMKKELIHVRLWLTKNMTDVNHAYDEYESNVIELSGFPITIQNISQKLNTILTFS